MGRRLALSLLVVALGAAGCGGDNDPNAPSRMPSDDPAPFVVGTRYELALTALGPANGCTSDGTVIVPEGFTDLPASGLHSLYVVLRREGSAWVAVPEAAGESLRLRVVLDQWPVSPNFTGTLEGRSTQAAPPITGLGTSIDVGGSATVDGLAVNVAQVGVEGFAAVGRVSGQLVFGARTRAVTCSSGQLILRSPR